MANPRTMASRLGLLAAAAAIAVAAVPAGASADACPNAAIRAQQHATALPDCRAYEQVSPVQKGGVDVLGDTQKAFSAADPDGDALAYSSSAAFGDAAGAAFPSIYRAMRGPDGWSTSAVSPPQDATVAGGLGGGNTSVVDAFTTDLSHAIVRTNHALTPGVPPGTPNLYVRDNGAVAYSLLTPGGPPAADFTNPYPEFAWATPDLSGVVFTSDYALTADAPVGAVPKVYVARHGAVELASVLPGDVPTGALAGDPNGDGSQGTISADGRYVFFGVVPDDYSRPTGLYRRDLVTDTTTEIVPAGTATWFAAASADGSRVLYKTTNVATNSDTYVLADVANGTSTMLEAADGSGVDAGATVAVSNDLRSVYFLARGTLVAGQDPVSSVAGLGLYRWQPLSGVVTHVANLASIAPDDLLQYDGGIFEDLPHRRDVAQTPGGAQLVFATSSELTPQGGTAYDNASTAAACDHQGGHRCTEVYRYDAASDVLTCVSCPDGTPTANAGLAGSVSVGGTSTLNQHAFAQARAISADGGTVFFETGERLDAADVNSRYDVYQWRDGEVTLLSTGRSNADAGFVDASADGRDVFIVTRARLAAGDADALADVYDVRVDGGFAVPAPSAPPCVGDACQGSAAGAPGVPVAATVAFGGSGNVAGAGVVPRSRIAVRRSVRGAVAKLRVRVPRAGVVRASGRAVRRVRRVASGRGTVVLRVALRARARRVLRRRARAAARQRARLRRAHRLTAHERRVLARRGSLRVRVRVVFAPRDGRRVSRTLRVRFRRAHAGRAAQRSAVAQRRARRARVASMGRGVGR